MAKKVFISSTHRDLIKHRNAVIQMFHDTNNLPIAMETFGSKPNDATTASLDGVRQADIFVGIYARRYGYRPDGDRSITELEYQEAVKKGIPRLIFTVKKDYADPDIDSNAEEDAESKVLLNIFIKQLEKTLVRDEFTTPEDLRQKVQNAVMNFLQAEITKLQQEQQNVNSRMTDSGDQRNHQSVTFSGSINANTVIGVQNSDNIINNFGDAGSDDAGSGRNPSRTAGLRRRKT